MHRFNPKEETQQEVSQRCGFTSDALSPGDVQRMLLTSQEEEVGRRWASPSEERRL